MVEHINRPRVIKAAVLVLVLLIFAISIIWLVPGGATEHRLAESIVQEKAHTLYLNGATDDQFINYYKLGLTIDLDHQDMQFTDDMPPAGPKECPTLVEDYGIDHRYKGNTLVITVDFHRIENRAGLSAGDKNCKAADRARGYKKDLDIDKNWLTSGEDKIVEITGTKDAKYRLAIEDQKLSLYKNGSMSGQIPYYPDGIAVMAAMNNNCPDNMAALMKEYAASLDMALADDRYPGLKGRSGHYHLHLMADGRSLSDMRGYQKNLGGRCDAFITKPNLKSLL